ARQIPRLNFSDTPPTRSGAESPKNYSASRKRTGEEKLGYNQWIPHCRGVAQPGSAPALGAGGRWFKSNRPDQFKQLRCLLLPGYRWTKKELTRVLFSQKMGYVWIDLPVDALRQ